MLTRTIAVVCAAATALCGMIGPQKAFAARPDVAQNDEGKRITIVSVPGLSMQELAEGEFARLPHLSRLWREASWGAMNIRTPGRGIEDTYLSWGAGNAADASPDIQAVMSGDKRAAGSGAELYRRYAGQLTQAAIVAPYIGKLKDINAQTSWRASVGSLGTVLERAGIHAAAWGNCDTMGAGELTPRSEPVRRRYAPLLIMNDSGEAAEGAIGSDTQLADPERAGGLRTDYAALAEQWAAFQRRWSSSVAVLELGDWYRLNEEKDKFEPHRFAVMKRTVWNELDEFAGGLLSGMGAADELWIVSPIVHAAAAKSKQLLAPVVRYSPGQTAALLTSASTRRSGIVAYSDLAPTVLSAFGLPKTERMVGFPFAAEKHPDPVGWLKAETAAMRQVYAARPPVLYTFAAYQIAVLLLGLAIALHGGLPGRRGRVGNGVRRLKENQPAESVAIRPIYDGASRLTSGLGRSGLTSAREQGGEADGGSVTGEISGGAVDCRAAAQRAPGIRACPGQAKPGTVASRSIEAPEARTGARLARFSPRQPQSDSAGGRSAVLRTLLFALLLAPAGLLAAGWAAYWPLRLTLATAFALVFAGAAFLARASGSRRKLIAALAWTGWLVTGLLVADGCTGAKAMQHSLLGYDVMIGARYYGIGNEFMGVLLGAAVLGLCAALQAAQAGMDPARRQRPQRIGASAAAGAGAARARAIARRAAAPAVQLRQPLRAKRPGASPPALGVLARAGGGAAASAAAAGGGALIAGLLASPALGANAGGAISAFVAFGLLAARLARGRRLVPLRWDRLLLALAALVAASLAALWLLNASAPARTGQQSHIGRAFARLLGGDWSTIADIASRKLQMNIHLIGVSAWSKVLATAVFVMAVMLLKPSGPLRRWQRRYPSLMHGFTAGAVGTLAALLFNDSGIVAAATMIVYIAVPMLLLRLHEKELASRRQPR